MDPEQHKDYLKPYREAVARFGPGFAATLWRDRDAQSLRFDVMLDLVNLDDAIIVDAGCGTGDLAAHLLDRSAAFSQYVGIDALTEMIDLARSRDLARSTFVVADILSDVDVFNRHQPDVICFSGTLNTMEESAARELVARAFHAAAQGVIFNFLSDRPHQRWAANDLTPARRFNTIDWLEWAMTQTSRLSFTQAYLDGHDATILMQHDGAEASAAKADPASS